ncbi:MAG: MATE family efflux transporter [Oscillibacter sp.]|jgi:putative MATE family efflux protein|nr:MATE family efflux transporter [Oscillibacter sp.]
MKKHPQKNTPQTADVPQENKMGYMPVNKLIINMALPMMISMMVQALYNVVDSVFVSRISENALTAVSLAFPMQNLMIAVAAGTGVGINALLSRSLGEKNFKRARDTAVNGVFLAVLSCLVFIIIGFTVVGTFYRSQTDVAEIVDYGVQYLTICCCISPGLFLGITFERLLQSTGRTIYTMITQSLGAIINLIFDPLLIFGLLGFPKLGVAGAAIATVAGQICGTLLAFYFCRKKNPEVPLHFRGFRPQGEIIKAIYAVGLPTIIMQSIGSVMVYGVNRILITFSTTATAVFGVYFKLQSFIFMPVFGLNNGLVPVMAYNYGARNKERIMKAMKFGVLLAMCIMGVGVLAFQLVPGTLLRFFDASAAMLEIGRPALRIISISFIPAAFCIVCGSMFQALGNGVYSMFVSVTRQLIVLLPAAYLLSLTEQLELVWLAFPIAEVASVCVSTLFFRRIYRQRISPLEKN